MMNNVGHIKLDDDKINLRELTPPNDIKINSHELILNSVNHTKLNV